MSIFLISSLRAYQNKKKAELAGEMNDNAIFYALRKLLAEGVIQRVGRNQYSAATKKKPYSHQYSEESVVVADKIEQEYAVESGK